jgi:hypothetical protein
VTGSFIVTTKRPRGADRFVITNSGRAKLASLGLNLTSEQAGWVVSRRAAATLEEASGHADDHVAGLYYAAQKPGDDLPPDYFEHSQKARDLTESGGSVGPLPDGTVIDVEPIRSDRPDPRREACPLIFTSDWLSMSEEDRCAAFNAAQETR